ncbi:MAG: methyl-accepting chemotaxis protein [Lachnospiraceae bacterium]|nr:methyl-accepting chemotaxis protein [Lachnospiraceae bacterium]
MFKNQSINFKLLTMTVPLMVIGIALAVYSGVMSTHILSESREVYYDQLKELTGALVTEDRDFYQAQLASEQVHANRLSNPDKVEEGLEDYDENVGQVLDNINKIESTFAKDSYLYNTFRGEGQSDSIAGLITTFKQNVSVWQESYDPHDNSGDFAAQYPAFLDARGELNEMEDSLEAYAKYQDSKLENKVKVTTVIAIIIIVAVVVLMAVYCLLTIRYLKDAVKVNAEVINHLAHGEFVRATKYTDYGDEMGAMIRDSNNVINTLEKIVQDIRASVDSVQGSSNEVADMANQISQTADGVSSAIQEIATGATQQADEIQHATENVGRISEAVTSVQGNTDSLSDTASNMNDNSKRSASELENLRKSSMEMSSNIAEIAERISATSKAVENINKKVEAITSIASQTNLLALNASIEAARAGEAGKGFAVVAEEIGKLAEDSAQSANDIRVEMDTLLRESQSAVAKAEEVQRANVEQQEVLDTTFTSVNGLIEGIETTVGGVHSISRNAQDCVDSKSVVVDAMDSLSAISEENAAASEETSASMQELNATVITLAGSADSLNEVARRLKEEMEFFK